MTQPTEDRPTAPGSRLNSLALEASPAPGLYRLRLRIIGTFDPDDIQTLDFSTADLEELRTLIDQLLPRSATGGRQ